MRKTLFVAAAVVILLAIGALAVIYSMTDTPRGSPQAITPVPLPSDLLPPGPAGPLPTADGARLPSRSGPESAGVTATSPVPPTSAPLPAADGTRFPSRRLRPGPGNVPAPPGLPDSPTPVPQAEEQAEPIVAEPDPPLAPKPRPKRQGVRR